MSEQDSFDVGSLATSEQLETEGVWRDLPKGAKLKVARWGNTQFSRLMRSKFKGVRDLIEGEDDLADQVSLEVLIEVMAVTILKDMSGISLGTEKFDKYTPAVGIRLLGIKDFREKVKALSEQAEKYREALENKGVNS